MTTDLQQWLESNIEGFSFSSAATKTGIPVSSVRRHLTDSKKTQSVHETVVAICRAYGLPVMEGLIRSGLITKEEVSDYNSGHELQSFSEKSLLLEVLKRVQSGSESELTRPVSAADISLALDSDPDYSKMSEQDAKDYDLAADKGDPNIAHDELPHEP